MMENVWGKAQDLQNLSSLFLSQVSSSSTVERNWSTYSFIHYVKRNRLTSKRAERLIYMHNSLRLRSRKLPEYLEGPSSRWDVDVEEASQIDDDGHVSNMNNNMMSSLIFTMFLKFKSLS